MAATIQTIHKPTRARGLDTSGNNNHAQIYSGRALEFDGITDYLTGPSTFPHSDTTIAIWINQDDATGEYRGIVGRDSSGGGSANWSIWWNAGLIRLFIGDTSNSYETIQSTTTLKSNTWYRLVCTVDFANKTGKIYLNGVLDTTVTWTRTHREDSDAILIGTLAESAEYHWHGKMSDAQIWNSVWTAADVEYDYLNPEQLALNRGGTSLTNSNLKLWYPMNEGHRGNQSYVLDASNTGLSDELVTNGDFSQDSDWTKGSNWTISGGSANIDGTSSNLEQTNFFEAGQTYKITLDVTTTSGNFYIEVMGGNLSYNGSALFDSSLTFYITPTGTNTSATFKIKSNSFNGSINDISIKSVNAKHNATTAFYGDDIVTNGTFASDANWTKGTGWTIGSGVADCDGTQSTWSAFINNADGASNAVVVGRTYQVTFDMTRSAGFIQVKTSGTHENHSSAGSKTTIFVADGTSWYFTADQHFVGTIDNVVLKEVGTASGWTDADQQLDIPQTALQSYNQLAWFDGYNDYVSIADHNDFSFGDGTNDSPFSVSAWIFVNEATNFPIIAKNSSSHREWILYIDANDKLLWLVYDNSASANQSRYYTTNWPHTGKWAHVVATYNGNEANADAGMNLYINGEGPLDEGSATSGSYTAMENKDGVVAIGASLSGGSRANGAITETCIWNKELSLTEIEELYNSGLALDATTHSASSDLIGYWRNNGLATWQDLTANDRDGTPTNITETMLITAGVDSSRDSQGFLMNRQRLTNSLNSINESTSSLSGNHEGLVVQDSNTLDITSDYTLCGWFKFEDLDYSYNFFNKKSTWNGIGYGMYRNTNGNMYMEYANDSGYKQLSRSFTPTLGTWYFVFCTHADGGNDVRGYAAVTDTSFTSSSNSGALDSVGTNDLELTIGVGQSGNDDHSHIQFSGQIDDVLVYNGKALTTNELMRNFKAGKRSHK